MKSRAQIIHLPLGNCLYRDTVRGRPKVTMRSLGNDWDINEFPLHVVCLIGYESDVKCIAAEERSDACLLWAKETDAKTVLAKQRECVVQPIAGKTGKGEPNSAYAESTDPIPYAEAHSLTLPGRRNKTPHQRKISDRSPFLDHSHPNSLIYFHNHSSHLYADRDMEYLEFPFPARSHGTWVDRDEMGDYSHENGYDSATHTFYSHSLSGPRAFESSRDPSSISSSVNPPCDSLYAQSQ